jgi:hypothetical protein
MKLLYQYITNMYGGVTSGEMSDLSSDEEEYIDNSEAKRIYANMLDQKKFNKQIVSQYRIKNMNNCVHCEQGDYYYQLVKIGFDYAVLKFFRCLSDDFVGDVLWTDTNLKTLPTKYKFLKHKGS